MFFILYALGVIVLIAGLAAGVRLANIVVLYALLAMLVTAWVNIARERRRAATPAHDRRHHIPPLQFIR